MAMEQPDIFRGPYVWQPVSEREAWTLKQQYGSDAVYAAGSTLLRTWWEGGAVRIPSHLIDVRLISGMDEIVKESEGDVFIGAGVPLSIIRRSPMLSADFPALAEAAFRIGAPSVRNLGTIGGNVVYGSGDSLTALLVYDAVLTWYDGQEKHLSLWAWLRELEGGRRNEGDLLLRIALPGFASDTHSGVLPGSRRFSDFRKVGRREAFTPSLVTTALAGRIGPDGRLSCARVAAGGGAAVPHRLQAVEAILEDSFIDEDLLSDVYEAVMDTYRPVGDVFAGEAYRKRTAANLATAALWKLAETAGREGENG